MSPVHILPSESQKQTEFARLFEESSKKLVLKEGEIVKGKIIRLARDYVVIDIGFKSEGHIPIGEFKTAPDKINAIVGDDIDVYLESIENEEGLMILSKERADSMKTWDRLEDIANKDSAVEGTVVAKVKGGLAVDIGVRAFLPGSQIDFRPTRNLDKYLGKTYKFKIIKLNKRRGNVVLSRKTLLEKERESLKETTLANLSEGQVFNGIVKNVTEYGVFVDLGGIDGLLHVTDMSWGRVGHPSEMFEVGDEIRVVVLKYDAQTQKVSLGLKQLMADPWAEVETKFPVGTRVSGKVTNLTDFGAFVELDNGIEGLVHISEMSWTKKIKHPAKILSVGDNVEAIVLDMDMDNKRISLGLKQVGPNPWEKLDEKYPIGSKVKGTVKNIADFGVFVDVGGEIDGLIHISDIAWVQNFGHPGDVFKKSDDLEAVVLHVSPEDERFSLGIKQLNDDPWNKIMSDFPEGTAATGKVEAINSGGAVIELDGQISGIIPVKEYPETLKAQDKVDVVVKKILMKERRFLLALKQ